MQLPNARVVCQITPEKNPYQVICLNLSIEFQYDEKDKCLNFRSGSSHLRNLPG